MSKQQQHVDTNLDHYREHFASRSARGAGNWLAPIASDAFALFEELGFPARTLEEWRYTNVAPIAKQAFDPALPGGATKGIVIPGSDLGGNRIVFIDGYHAPEHSTLPDGGEVTVHTLAELAREREAPASSSASIYSTLATPKEDGFTALNTAFAEDGAVITFNRGVTSRAPIHLVFVSSGSAVPRASFPRVVIVAQPGSHGLVVQEHVSLEGNPALTCAVSEIVTEADASLDMVLLQRESDATHHIARQCVRQQRNSRFALHTLNLGGAILRNDLEIVLADERAECSLNGLYLATGDQIVDNHTLVDHAVPDCTSNEYYKGIMADRSRGVFRGRVIVRPNAQRTEATQQNRNLLLSRTAEVDTKPQLEIYADDVKCNHGSSIGQLDEDALFFLQARGLDVPSARVLLTMGFASQVTQSIANSDVRDWAAGLVTERLEALFDGGGAQ